MKAASWQLTSFPAWQAACQLCAGTMVSTLFVFVTGMQYRGSCLATTLYIAAAILVPANGHVGTKLMASCQIFGSCLVGSTLAGAVASIAKAASFSPYNGNDDHMPYNVLYTALSLVGLAVLVTNRVAVGPPYLAFMATFSCACYGIVLINAQKVPSPDQANPVIWMWRNVAGSTVLSGAVAVGCTMAAALLVLPTCAVDVLRQHVKDVLVDIGKGASGFSSEIFAPHQRGGIQRTASHSSSYISLVGSAVEGGANKGGVADVEVEGADEIEDNEMDVEAFLEFMRQAAAPLGPTTKVTGWHRKQSGLQSFKHLQSAISHRFKHPEHEPKPVRELEPGDDYGDYLDINHVDIKQVDRHHFDRKPSPSNGTLDEAAAGQGRSADKARSEGMHPARLTGWSFDSCRQLVGFAQGLIPAATMEPAFITGYHFVPGAWGAVIAAVSTLMTRVAALEMIEEEKKRMHPGCTYDYYMGEEFVDTFKLVYAHISATSVALSQAVHVCLHQKHAALEAFSKVMSAHMHSQHAAKVSLPPLRGPLRLPVFHYLKVLPPRTSASVPIPVPEPATLAEDLDPVSPCPLADGCGSWREVKEILSASLAEGLQVYWRRLRRQNDPSAEDDAHMEPPPLSGRGLGVGAQAGGTGAHAASSLHPSGVGSPAAGSHAGSRLGPHGPHGSHAAGLSPHVGAGGQAGGADAQAKSAAAAAGVGVQAGGAAAGVGAGVDAQAGGAGAGVGARAGGAGAGAQVVLRKKHIKVVAMDMTRLRATFFLVTLTHGICDAMEMLEAALVDVLLVGALEEGGVDGQAAAAVVVGAPAEGGLDGCSAVVPMAGTSTEGGVDGHAAAVPVVRTPEGGGVDEHAAAGPVMGTPEGGGVDGGVAVFPVVRIPEEEDVDTPTVLVVLDNDHHDNNGNNDSSDNNADKKNSTHLWQRLKHGLKLPLAFLTSCSASLRHGPKLLLSWLTSLRGASLVLSPSLQWTLTCFSLLLGVAVIFGILDTFFVVLPSMLRSAGWGQLIRDRKFQAGMKYFLALSIMLLLALGVAGGEVGANIPLYIAYLSSPFSVYGFLACAICTTERVEATLSLVALWIMGAAAGGTLSMATMWNSSLATNPYGLVAVISFVTIIICFLSTGPYKRFVITLLMTMNSVILCQYHLNCNALGDNCHGSTAYFGARTLSVILGTIVAFVVGNLVLPWYTSVYAMEVMASVLLGAADAFEVAYEAFIEEGAAALEQSSINGGEAIEAIMLNLGPLPKPPPSQGARTLQANGTSGLQPARLALAADLASLASASKDLAVGSLTRISYALETRGVALLQPGPELGNMRARAAASLAQVQASLARDTTMWKSGILATPTIVPLLLHQEHILLDRLSILTLGLNTPFITGSFNGWAFRAMVQPLRPDLSVLITCTAEVTAAAASILHGDRSAAAHLRVKEAVKQLDIARVKVRYHYVDLRRNFLRLVRGVAADQLQHIGHPDDAVRVNTFFFSLAKFLEKICQVANMVAGM